MYVRAFSCVCVCVCVYLACVHLVRERIVCTHGREEGREGG
jgi:hypothetical protein